MTLHHKPGAGGWLPKRTTLAVCSGAAASLVALAASLQATHPTVAVCCAAGAAGFATFIGGLSAGPRKAP